MEKLAGESRQLIEANAIQRSLKTARLDENYVVAGSLGYYTCIGLIRPCSCHLVPCYGFPGNREPVTGNRELPGNFNVSMSTRSGKLQFGSEYFWSNV